MKTKSTEKSRCFSPGESLDIYEAVTCYQDMLAYIVSNSTPVFDLSSVKSCDAAGAQLIIAASKSAAAAGKKLKCVNISPSVHEAWNKAGLSQTWFTLCPDSHE
jgi:anti-anti-sigma regulatory factor